MNNLCQVVSVALLSNRMSLKQLLIKANENNLIQMMNENSLMDPEMCPLEVSHFC